jgi:hypothetical protein
MVSWVHLSGSTQQSTVQLDDRENIKDCKGSIFKSIPPERIGLNGEYDHSGLAKRVMVAFQAQCDRGEAERVQVLQRGRVVILVGAVSSYQVLNQLISLALSTDGADSVETHGVEIDLVRQKPITSDLDKRSQPWY